MAEISPTVGVLIVAGAGFVGAVLGSVVRPVIDAVLGHKVRKAEWKRESLEKKLNELYRPMYEQLIILPESPFDHYFSDWEDWEFNRWLQNAIDMMLPMLHLLPDDILGRIFMWREMIEADADTERQVRWLYDRIQNEFHKTRRELGIA